MKKKKIKKNRLFFSNNRTPPRTYRSDDASVARAHTLTHTRSHTPSRRTHRAHVVSKQRAPSTAPDRGPAVSKLVRRGLTHRLRGRRRPGPRPHGTEDRVRAPLTPVGRRPRPVIPTTGVTCAYNNNTTLYTSRRRRCHDMSCPRRRPRRTAIGHCDPAGSRASCGIRVSSAIDIDASCQTALAQL